MPELVIDVGLMDGEDSAYYLKCGYRVVGVDADPLVIERCTSRFAREISSGTLTLLNIGIIGVADPEQTLTFYRNLSQEGQSSFLPEYGQRGGKFLSMEVRCITLRQLIDSHGVPFYLKLDIEGMDEAALGSLDRSTTPNYLSAELSRSSKIIEHLHSIGYRHFKLINGAFHTTSMPIFRDEIGWRLLRKASRRIPLLHHAMRRLPHKARPKMEWDSPFSVDGEAFGPNTTGPFGEKTHGGWITHTEARKLLDKIGEVESLADGALWWDLHAAKRLAQEPLKNDA
jgi:FkbM family methyltransferase